MNDVNANPTKKIVSIFRSVCNYYLSKYIYINNSAIARSSAKFCSTRAKINVVFHDTGLFRCNETVVNTRFSQPTMTLRINFY